MYSFAEKFDLLFQFYGLDKKEQEWPIRLAERDDGTWYLSRTEYRSDYLDETLGYFATYSALWQRMLQCQSAKIYYRLFDMLWRRYVQIILS